MADDPWSEFPVIGGVTATMPAVMPGAGAWEQFPTAGPQRPEQSLTAAPGDKYRAAAIAEREGAIAKGRPLAEGYTERAGRGLGFGWYDEAMAAMQTPFEMASRRVGPGEAYRYAKAREDLRAEETAKATKGILGGAAESQEVR